MKNVGSPDRVSIRRRVLLRVLSSPATLFPLLGGVTAALGTWAFNVRPDIGILAGVAGVLGAAGMFLTQLMVGGERRAEQAIEEIQEETRESKERALDDLYRRLGADEDPRTEAALSDLRSLARALEALKAGDTPAAPAAVGIQLDAAELFEQCVRSLERSLQLWHTARTMATRPARQALIDQRERLLRDVFESIRQLGKILVGLQELETGGSGDSALARIRAELDENLTVAKRVDERLRTFEQNLDRQSSE